MEQSKQTPDIFEQASAKRAGEEKTYISEYEKFINEFRLKEVSAEEVGVMIARFAQYFMQHNLIMQRALRIYASVRRDLTETQEPGGKQMSVSKVELLCEATPEAAAYTAARAHVQNIEQCINALKALQRGIMNEYAYQQ